MSNDQPNNAFGEEHAATYDERFAKLAPLKDALHLCMRAALAEAPEDARVLCVGAGTGAEMLYLAEAWPGWTFTLVEPSAPMLNRCRKRAEEAGLTDRCTFHEGYLDTLPVSAPFDVATSILVSQFVLDPEARRAYFQEIANRLRPGGHLVTADLATGQPDDTTAPDGPLLENWMALMRYNDANDEAIEKYRDALANHVAVWPAPRLADLITSSGFEGATCICQTLLIHTWHARRR